MKEIIKVRTEKSVIQNRQWRKLSNPKSASLKNLATLINLRVISNTQREHTGKQQV